MNGHKVRRTNQFVKTQMEIMNELGWDYTIQHGTYTTKIHSPVGIMTLSTIQFSNKVFVAANMVKRDCLKTDYGAQIMNSKHSKMNYANNPTITELHDHIVYNIDIKGAYASCLKNSGLITEPTYQYLLGLKKDERLPAVGMLAKSHIKYIYKGGECVEVIPYRSNTSELFFYLIQKIDEIMREIKWILGDYFIYYWVDGVFIRWNTPQKKIDEVFAYLESLNYKYTFQECYQFKYINRDGQCVISMYKEDEFKEWNFRSSNADDDLLKRMIYSNSIKTINYDTQNGN